MSAKRKFAFVGFTVSREDAPWGDPEWSLAGCNNLWAQPRMEPYWPKADCWYDLHDKATILGDENHTGWLREGHKPCWVMPAVRQPDWPNAHDFPRDAILAWAESAGFAGLRYFTNSVSWMIAHAIYTAETGGWSRDGAEIGLWGIDMAQGSEYSSQRPSCEYWLGVAEGLGIKVTVAERADLLRCAFLYGTEDGSDFARKMRSRQAELKARANELAEADANLRAQLEQVIGMRNQTAGALEDCNYILDVWLQPEGTRKGGEDPSISTAPEPHLQVVKDG